MTTYTMTGSGSLRDIGNASIFGAVTARSGGDLYNLNGFTLTIDQDTRYGLSGNNSSATAATTLGTITVSATLGGTLNIDGRYVRMIPYTGGSGTLTTGATIVAGSTASAKAIGLYSAINSAPVLTGVATGWIKVTAWNGVAYPTSGTFTDGGFTYTISGPSIVGFIEVTGDDASTITANRLGAVNILGEWFSVTTTTSGTSTTTYQLPTNGSIQYYPAVWVETGVGTGTYEAYPCRGSLVAASSAATDSRGKFCSVSTAGLLRLGHDGTNVVGYLPPAGLRIRVPNVLLQTCLATARNVNALPNATLATRYDFTTTGGGVVNMDKVVCNWYLSIAQAYSFNASYVAAATSVSLTEIAQPMTINNLVVGQEAANTQTALVLGLCYAGGTFTDCNLTRASMAATYVATVTDCSDFTFSDVKTRTLTVKTNVGGASWSLLRAVSCTWTNCSMVGAKSLINACSFLTFTNTHYNDVVTGVTATTAVQNNSVWEFATAASSDIMLDGLDFNGILNTAPYLAIASINVAGCSRVTLRNIGTYAAPLALGTTTVFTGNVMTVVASGAAFNIRLQRIYVSNTRLNGVYYTSATSPDNSSTNFLLENVFSDYADAADLGNVLNLVRKGIGGAPSVASAIGIYGTHFIDRFTSTTAGTLCILMNEATPASASQVTLTNGANFTAAGGLYMPTVGMTATFELPYYCIGHTGFSATAGTMAGGTVGNYRFEFSIDKNDGAGWSTMTVASYTSATLATALNAITGLSAVLGWKLKLKISTTATNATAITSFLIPLVSTTTTQAYQYPLDTASVAVSGLVTGSRVKAYKISDNTVLFNGAETLGAVSFTTSYIGAIGIDVRKASEAPYYQPWVTQLTTVAGATVSATALQQLDE